MPDGNPYDDLAEKVGLRLPDRPPSDNPYDDLFAQSARYTIDRLPPSLAGLFAKGVGKGILRPLTIFGVGGEEEEEQLTPGQMVAEVAGEFLGFGVGFLPFLKGAQLGLKGVGLLRPLAPEVAEMVGARFGLAGAKSLTGQILGARMAEGALAFGAFEAGAAEELKDVPGHLAFGVLLGGVGELAFGATAMAWRNRFAKAKALGAEISPIALHLERQMTPVPDDGVHLLQIKLAGLGSAEAQLDDIAMRVGRLSWPGGVGIIPVGTHDPKGFITRLHQYLPKGTQTVVHTTEDGLKEVLVTAPKVGRLLPTVGDGHTLEAMYASGTPTLTTKEAINLIRGDADAYGHPTLEIEEGGVMMQLMGTLGGYNSAQYIKGKLVTSPTVQINPNIEAMVAAGGAKGVAKWQAIEYSTVVHEYSHHWTTLATGEIDLTVFRLKDLGVRLSPELKEWVGSSTKEVFELASFDDILKLPAFDGSLARELTKVSASARGELYGLGEEIVRSDWKYFGQDAELISAFFESFLSNPKRTREIAPKLVGMMEEIMASGDFSQKLTQLLTTVEHKNTHNLMWKLWEMDPSGKLTMFRRTNMNIGQKQLRQFAQDGGFGGMGVEVEGRPWMWGRKIGDKVKLLDTRNPEISITVPLSSIQKPTFPTLYARQEAVATAMRDFITVEPKWLALKLFDKTVSPEGGIRKTILELEGFDTARNLPEWLNRVRRSGRLNPEHEVLGETFDLTMAVRHGHATMDDIVRSALDDLGIPGIVFNDQGRISLFVAHPEKLVLSQEVHSAGLMKYADGYVNQHRLIINDDSLLESVLANAGVQPHEMDYFKSMNRFRESIESIVDPEFLMMERAVQSEAIKLARVSDVPTRRPLEHLEEVAASVGASTSRTTSGGVRIFDNYTGQELASFAGVNAREDGIKFLNQLGPPPKGELERIVDVVTGERERIKAMIETARGQGLGDDVVRALEVELESLNNGAFVDYMTGIASGLDDVAFRSELPKFAADISTDVAMPSAVGTAPKFQSQMNTLDYAPGLMERITNAVNIFGATFTNMETLSKTFERTGVGPMFTRVFEPAQKAILAVDHELGRVPRALLGERTFNDQLKVIEKLARRLSTERQHAVVQYLETMSREEIERAGGLLVRGMTEKELVDAARIVELGLGDSVPMLMGSIRTLKRAAKNLDVSLQQMIDDAKMPDEWREVIRLILDSSTMSKNDYSIFAVSRWASARPLERGFKTGREQFASEMKLNPRELKLAGEMDRFYDASFEASALSRERYLGGYFPHIKAWFEQGFAPSRQFFKDIVPDGFEWTGSRFRSGELDAYLMDPVMSSFKHVRGMMMNKYFDPIMPDIRRSIAAIRKKDVRAGRISTEYIAELMGKPHVSFTRLDQMMEKSYKLLTGRELPEGLSRNVINNLTALAYGATIPFRPGLIARNYFQLVQTILPRTGPDAFFKGLQRAGTKEGWKEALEAGIITANVAPVHATTEVFGFGSSAFSRRVQAITDRGFKWYQSADDYGRAVAYHAQKVRVDRYMDNVMGGKINFERFLELAKVKTFDPLDEQEFIRLWGTGQYDQAKTLLGNRLARETIFRYGHANHPAGWGGATGRLFGQFGTWPIQYKDFLLQGISRGTTKDKIEFIVSHSSINLAVVGIGAGLGMNLATWVTFPSLDYTGGPFADATIDLVRMRSGSPTERRLAWQSLKDLLPTLEDPRSIFLPGSYLLGDIWDAVDEDTPIAQLMRASGIRMMKPREKTWLDYLDF